MYPPELVAPMKTDLTSEGFIELLTVEDVDNVLDQSEESVFLVVNSVCGCAASNARPAAKMASKNAKRPDKFVTVFAGVDAAATQRARQYTLPYPPSSPSMALFKGGKLLFFVERMQIEGRSAEMIAQNLKMAFDQYL